MRNAEDLHDMELTPGNKERMTKTAHCNHEKPHRTPGKFLSIGLPMATSSTPERTAKTALTKLTVKHRNLQQNSGVTVRQIGRTQGLLCDVRSNINTWVRRGSHDCQTTGEDTAGSDCSDTHKIKCMRITPHTAA